MKKKVKPITKVEVEVEVDVDYFVSSLASAADYDQIIQVLDDLDEEVGDGDFTEDVFLHFLEKVIQQVESDPDTYAGTSWSMVSAMRGLLEKENK